MVPNATDGFKLTITTSSTGVSNEMRFESGPIMIYFKDPSAATASGGTWTGVWEIQRWDADEEAWVTLVSSSATAPQIFLNCDETFVLRIAVTANTDLDDVTLVMVQNLTTKHFKGDI